MFKPKPREKYFEPIGRQRATLDDPGARTCHICGTHWPPVQVVRTRFEPVKQCLNCGNWMKRNYDPVQVSHVEALNLAKAHNDRQWEAFKVWLDSESEELETAQAT